MALSRAWLEVSRGVIRELGRPPGAATLAGGARASGPLRSVRTVECGRSAPGGGVMAFGRDGFDGLNQVLNRMRLERIEAELAELKRLRRDVATEAHSRLERGQPVTRAQAAAYLGVSTKKLQRMEKQGKLSRCRDLGAVVLYAARDVLRLA